MSTQRNNILKIWLVLLLIAPIVLWFLPSAFFDNSSVIVCPSRLFFDVECFGCGITRAVMHLHHLEFEEALFYNTGVVVIYPLLALMWFQWVRGTLTELGILKQLPEKA